MQIFISELSLVLFVFSLFSSMASIIFDDSLFFLWGVVSFIMLFIAVLMGLISNNSVVFSRTIFNFLIAFIFMVFAASIPMLFLYDIGMIDCFFNSVSAVTTSGILFGKIGKSLLLWLSLIQWFAGLLFILFSVVVLSSKVNLSFYPYYNFQTLSFESSSLFEIIKSLSVIFIIYSTLTICCIFLLLISGLPVFSSLIYALSSISTGGILDPSYSLDSMSFLSLSIISFFSILGSINFTLHNIIFLQIYNFFQGRKNLKLSSYFSDPELIFASVLLIAILVFGLFCNFYLPDLLFNVISAITSTGFLVGNSISNDYQFMIFLLILAILIGGSSISTSSGIKLSRARSLILHSINDIKLSNLPYYAEDDIKHYKTPITINSNINTYIFFTSFIVFYIALICLFAISADNFEVIDLFSISATSISNSGNILPLLGVNSLSFSSHFKFIYILGMFLGRFEVIYPIILFFSGNRLFKNKF